MALKVNHEIDFFSSVVLFPMSRMRLNIDTHFHFSCRAYRIGLRKIVENVFLIKLFVFPFFIQSGGSGCLLSGFLFVVKICVVLDGHS